jgi:chromosomal replication initiation ATPase DnaA
VTEQEMVEQLRGRGWLCTPPEKLADAQRRSAMTVLVFRSIEDSTGIPWHRLIEADRSRMVYAVRRATWWLLREIAGLSYPQIGRLLKRDHSTVIYGCRGALDEAKSRHVIEAVLNNRLVPWFGGNAK